MISIYGAISDSSTAEKHPGLRLIRIISDSSTGLSGVRVFSTVDADALKTAYIRYRTLNHEAILAGRKGRTEFAEVENERQLVEGLWAQWMSSCIDWK